MKSLVLTLAFTLLASPLNAQDDPLTAPLAQAFAPLDDTDDVGLTLECAALFRALAIVLDPATEAGASFMEREGTMASVAAILWSAGDGRDGMSPEDVFAVLLPPMNAATDLFLDHMNSVAGETGSPFDTALLSRVEFCVSLHDAVLEGEG